MTNDERPERRSEGKDGTGAHQEGPNSVQAGRTQRRERSAPTQAPKTGRSTRQGNKRSTDGNPNVASDAEPGPGDDDGLPESAGRRVPS